ncbi:MAG: SUMF1/EgtB/PvdO family nonheme iron enzyme [Kiritimatiellales bacterium]
MRLNWLVTVLVALCGMAQAALVTIGNAGNAADTTGYGDVSYTYRISATEVTIAEFTASGAGNGNENYWNDGTRTVGANAPASYVSLYEAMQYCNWMTSGNTNNGAYQFIGGTFRSADRASAVTTYGTVYALPTENEWYKAAYFKPDASGYSLYANGTGTAPSGTEANYDANGNHTAWTVGSGLQEQNGTYDMMGNVWEWMEALPSCLRGGSFSDVEYYLRPSYRGYGGNSAYEGWSVGFRVVAIPEPATALSLVLGGLIVTGYRRLRKSYGHF